MKWFRTTKDRLINIDNAVSIARSRPYEISFQHENGSILVKLPNGEITRLSTEKKEDTE